MDVEKDAEKRNRIKNVICETSIRGSKAGKQPPKRDGGPLYWKARAYRGHQGMGGEERLKNVEGILQKPGRPHDRKKTS